MFKAFPLFALVLLLRALPSSAEELKVAVAANFLQPMQQLAASFEADSAHTVVLTPGSSGKLFAQIQHGAPFQLFYSADADKPEALLKAGLAVADSRFTYALGRLALWSTQSDLKLGEASLHALQFERLAIANPRLAPYGEAAREFLLAIGCWEAVQGKLVQGENIAQTFQFVASGNAQLGLVALSQAMGRGGSQWLVPETYHAPIQQDAVLLTRGADSEAAQAFLRFTRSDTARAIIAEHGYGLVVR